jgi:hypothetical protein
MKVAFAIDFLIERTPEVFLLELLLAGFDDAEIYCLSHAPGKILGRIETHRIHSTPFLPTPDRAWMLPSVARQIKVAADVDKLIIISSGWAHTIKTSAKTERFVWLHDFAPKKLELKGWRKIFSYHHREVKMKALEAEKNVAFATKSLASSLGFPEGKVIYPGFKTDDYPIVPDEQHTGEYPYHLILLNGAPERQVREVIVAAHEANVDVKFMGADEVYAEEKKQNLGEFVGDHCAATTAGFTHSARAVWVLGETTFPTAALGALCGGRPVVVPDLPQYREVLPVDGAWFVNGNVKGIFTIANRDFLSPDKKALRRAGLKFNERLFKNQMRAWAGIKPTKEE